MYVLLKLRQLNDQYECEYEKKVIDICETENELKETIKSLFRVGVYDLECEIEHNGNYIVSYGIFEIVKKENNKIVSEICEYYEKAIFDNEGDISHYTLEKRKI